VKGEEEPEMGITGDMLAVARAEVVMERVATTAMCNNCRQNIQDLLSRTSTHRIDLVSNEPSNCTFHLRGQPSMQHSLGSSNRLHCLS
jgi:hypothetical protein